ncbi:MAG: FG-GAP-like repeat-containing protein, partial [Thermoguttaceae bacterium]
AGIASCARLTDVDSDGDLDCLAFRASAGSLPAGPSARPAPSLVFNNNRDGSYEEIAERLGLRFADAVIGTVVHDDFDNDRDVDMIAFPAVSGRPIVWVNERVWQYHVLDPEVSGLDVQNVVGATSADLNSDGRQDLLVFCGEQLHLFLNESSLSFVRQESFENQFSKLGGTNGQAIDIDNDGDLDLLLADAHRGGSRGPLLLLNRGGARFEDAALAEPGIVLDAVRTPSDAACLAADFTGDGACDMILIPVGGQPALFENLTRGNHWIELDLRGTQPQDNKARSNSSAIGARVEMKTGTILQQFTVGVPTGAGVVPPLRIHAGLGPFEKVDWLRIFWPDAVLQAELELAGGQVMPLEELPRKTSSCPTLFTWDGSRYRFVADFAGVGGLGFFLAPGRYAPPDPTEYLPIPVLEPQDGQYVLQVLEPLEEAVYFDEARLVAVDHPIGTEVWPREMMAVNSPPPPFELFCTRDKIEAVSAVDQEGDDVTGRLAAIDRQYAGATEIDPRFLGFARPHFVELDFGDRLGKVAADARLVMYLFGWVEYGYSSTNFAASQAGMTLKAPTIQVERGGRWLDVMSEVGYPAGLEHVMTVNVTGAILPGDRKVRVASNMELYWDRIYLGVDEDLPLRVQEVPVASASLAFFGYPREYSPDGKMPNIYDYHNVDRAMGWKLMAGDYTRFGEVAELLGEADDCYVIMGRGEQLTLRFPADALAPVPEGQRRTFLLKSDAYCKDMDLYTAFPDTVGPLPFHGMSGYPYGRDESYPDTPKIRSYREKYNTRRVGNQSTSPRHDR